MSPNLEAQPVLIRSLLQPGVYDHAVTDIQLIETHISWVILTGEFAYKIKKPINLGFLDFSTLEKRRFCCDEELRLNSRLAAEIYLQVVPITGIPERPVLSGTDDAFEYAVKMVQFPQSAQLDQMLAANELHTHHIDAIASMVAEFHQANEVASRDSDFGDPQHVYAPVAENFIQIRQHVHNNRYDERLSALEAFSKSSHDDLIDVFRQRKRDGFIRECHGDMHLRNLVWFNGKPLAFDCLEFNPALRWIDTMSEIAFLVMDLQDRKQPLLAQRCLNHYLERGGDYPGLLVLRFYQIYRALVRAKVDAIRVGQQGIDAAERHEAEQEFQAYLELAQAYTQPGAPRLIITCGMSASGKSTLTQPVLEITSAIRIRSDVERKRLFGLQADANSSAGIDRGIYSAEAGIKTYQKLRQLSASVLDAGYAVIVDAAFLQYEQRQMFRQLADDRQIPFVIIEFTASADTLRQRIRDRVGDVSDADLAVLEHQLATAAPLRDRELPRCIRVDTEEAFEPDQLAAEIDRVCARDTA